MAKQYEIIPGRSAGPFQLEQTREEIMALGIEPSREMQDGRTTHYPLVEMSKAELARASGMTPGIYLSFDDSGRCCSIHVHFSYRREPPIFTLLGEVVNGMTIQRAGALIGSIASDVKYQYASVLSVAAGIQATMYEAGDEHIISITVRPAEPA